MPDPTEHHRPFETYDTTVSKIAVLTDRVKDLRFQLPPGKKIEFHAGQFVQVFIPTQDKPKRTSYSIASPPYESDHVELCVTHVEGGFSSGYLHSLKEGDKVQVMGPLGRFTMPETLPRDVVFIATGSGIAPFRSMIRDLLYRKVPRQIYLVFGNRFEPDIIYRSEWDELEKQYPNFKRLFVLSRDTNWKGARGYVQDAVPTFVPDLKNKDFYICGLVKMIDAVSQKLLSLGVPTEQIHFERYD